MMSTTSRIAATIDDLVALARQALPDLDIYDGPTVSQNFAKDEMFIGVDDPTAQVITAATGQQDWASLGHNRREENFTVYGTAIAWTGSQGVSPTDTTASELRSRAFAHVAALEAALRDDPSVGSLSIGETLRQVGIQITSVRPMPTGKGLSMHVQFSVLCKCRI